MLCASGQRTARDTVSVGQIGDVEHLDALVVADEAIAELGLERHRLVEHVAAEHGRDLGMLRIVERHDDQAGVAADVGIGADDA